MTEEFSYSYSPHTFPFHPDCYTWPQVAVVTKDGESVILNVHCLRDANRKDDKEFRLVGFIGMDRDEQISKVVFIAQGIGAEVIMFEGVGFTDEVIGGLLMCMKEPLPEEYPGQKISFVIPGWPTRFQRRILREALDMCRHGDFHESSLAYRMHAPVEEIHQHLELLTDLGLMESA